MAPQQHTLFITSEPWKYQAEDIFDKSEAALHAELKTCENPAMKAALADRLIAMESPALQDAVKAFGGALRGANSDFVPVVKSILAQPQQGMPEPLRALIKAGLEWREETVPASLERDPNMRETLTDFFTQAKGAFDAKADAKAMKAASAKAIVSANSYMDTFQEHTTAAEALIMNAAETIEQSPRHAVDWCRKLAGFTPQEILPHGIDHLNQVISKLSDQAIAGELWKPDGVTPSPGLPIARTAPEAIAVLNAAAIYISTGMPTLSSAVAPVNDAVAIFDQKHGKSAPEPLMMPTQEAAPAQATPRTIVAVKQAS